MRTLVLVNSYNELGSFTYFNTIISFTKVIYYGITCGDLHNNNTALQQYCLGCRQIRKKKINNDCASEDNICSFYVSRALVCIYYSDYDVRLCCLLSCDVDELYVCLSFVVGRKIILNKKQGQHVGSADKKLQRVPLRI